MVRNRAAAHVPGMDDIAPRFVPFVLLVLAAAAASACAAPAVTDPPPNYGTATCYAPQQDASTYEAPPPGYEAVYTELLARHGSRGLTAPKEDFAVYAMWKEAAARGALTELGAQLGPDVMRIVQANASNGYGNETRVGFEEHTALAKRMLAREPALWKKVGDERTRSVVVVSSGVGRAVDSAGYFVQSLEATQPDLTPLVQPAETNRYLLYFHDLDATKDRVTDPLSPYFETYQNSLAYQAYLKSADFTAKKQALAKAPAAEAAGRIVLERLFSTSFVDAIASGELHFANTGTYFGVTGDGKTKIASLADAGALLYVLYAAAPSLRNEANVDMTPYLPREQADVFAEQKDAQSFYRMGPGIAEKDGTTYRIARILQDDFFSEVDRIAAGDRSHAAKLRFAHAEIVVPFAAQLGIDRAATSVPQAKTFSYTNNPWRGAEVAPMAANVQWDVFTKGGSVLVKMLYDEKETDFMPACASAKIAPTSHYYDYAKLAACYGYTR